MLQIKDKSAVRVSAVAMLIAVWHALTLGLLIGIILMGCALLTPATVRTILGAADLTCVLLTQSTDTEAVLKACRIEEQLRPAVEEAIAARVAAEKAGFRMTTSR